METEFRYAEQERLPKGEGLRAYNLRFKEFYDEIKDKNSVWNKVWETATDLRKSDLDKNIFNERNDKERQKLKRTKNLSKIYAAHQVMRWQEEMQSDMALKEINPQELNKLGVKEEVAQQDFSNFIETKLKEGKWPDARYRLYNRQKATEFSEEVINKEQTENEMLFKEEFERIAAIAHLGLAKVREFSEIFKKKEAKVAMSAMAILGVAVLGCATYLNLKDIDVNAATSDQFRTTDPGRQIINPPPTIEQINQGEVVVVTPDARQNILSKRPNIIATSELVKTPEATPDYFSWLNPARDMGGNLDLSQPFIVNVSADAADVMGYKSPRQLVAGKPEVNRFHDNQNGEVTKWLQIFENPIGDMNATGIEQGNNGRAIVYCHSGSLAGVEWPCNWVKTATWYPDKTIGQEITFTQGNFIYHYQVKAINTVSAESYINTVREFSLNPDRPMLRDIASLMPNPEVLNNPGIDIVVCGGKEVPLHGYRTIMSTVLESVERINNPGIQTSTFSSREILDGTIENLETASVNVNNYFENQPLTPGQTFSFLDANENFTGQNWINGTTFETGDGACDIATLLYRSVRDYSNLLGLPFEQMPTRNGINNDGNILFRVGFIPHQNNYQGMPADEVSVHSWGPEDLSSTDFTISLNNVLPNGVPLPADLSIRFRVEQDGSGGFNTVVVSNYSVSELSRIIQMGMIIEVGR